MMQEEVMLAGFGGQGVLSMGQLLAYAGMLEDKHVSWIPSYGPEMRGGTANCLVVVSDFPVSSPLFSEPTTLIVLNRPSLEKYEKDLVPGGLLLLNSSLIDVEPKRRDIKVVRIPMNELALQQLGTDRVANMILLGAFAELTKVLSYDSLAQALFKVLPEHRHELIPVNRQALEIGIDFVRRNQMNTVA